jgi:hypothetical protein
MGDVALLIGAFGVLWFNILMLLSDTNERNETYYLVMFVGCILAVGWAMRGLVGV